MIQMRIFQYIFMKKTAELISVARKLELKYLQKAAAEAKNMIYPLTQALQTAVSNASTQNSSGIWPITKMVGEDGVNVSFDITRTDGTFGKTITVDNLQIAPSNRASEVMNRYQPILGQVKAYLDKNPEVFPGSYAGGDVQYDGSKFTLKWDGIANTSTMIASNP